MDYSLPSAKTIYVLLIIGLFAAMSIGAVLHEGQYVERVGRIYIAETLQGPNIANSVYGVYGKYRFYDTILELLIFSTAVLGISIFSDLESAAQSGRGRLVESHVVTASTSILYPVIALFGLYLAYSAHLGPGGGFAGGVISGSGVLLLAVALGAREVGRRFYEKRMKKVEYLILLLAIAIGFSGLLFPSQIYQGLSGRVMILAVNLAIGIKVFIGTWTILHFFVKHRGEV